MAEIAFNKEIFLKKPEHQFEYRTNYKKQVGSVMLYRSETIDDCLDEEKVQLLVRVLNDF